MFVIKIRNLYLNFNQHSNLKVGRAISRVLLRILVSILIALAIIPVALLDFALRLAPERGDTQQVEKLKQQGPPPYYGNGVTLKSATYLTDLYDYMNQNPAIANRGFSTLQDIAGSEYGLYDKVNFVRGILDTFDVVYPQLWSIDFRKQATSLEAPVYFLIGRHDVSAPPQLTEEYFNILSAPHKELIWFERSGHSPWINESAKFVEVMVNKILKNTGGSDDQTNVS